MARVCASVVRDEVRVRVGVGVSICAQVHLELHRRV